MNVQVTNTGENSRSMLVGDYQAKLERRDPHGFWFFVWSKGPVPDALAGAYTNYKSAAEAFESWFVKLPKRLKPVPATKAD